MPLDFDLSIQPSGCSIVLGFITECVENVQDSCQTDGQAMQTLWNNPDLSNVELAYAMHLLGWLDGRNGR